MTQHKNRTTFRAPADCSQYLTGPAGNFQSFNYNNAAGQLIENESYNICIRQEKGSCPMSSIDNSGTRGLMDFLVLKYPGSEF